eukprot:Blabericola_migrator_1__2360@NODE_165_length_12243_cov_242_656784_g143_i0_p11_GENE_NODE_165_length_12243_cov_242_656784_g143_i0NODE_165_length_12243_cov_242_656784_g143_i0_p11_ORF_typecomplete_len129_score15_92HHV1_VABD/PF16852_5/16HHV1_VABD/PF16852_5/1_7_NODE_165_length_12243_cov_242_656784_g143_i040404426
MDCMTSRTRLAELDRRRLLLLDAALAEEVCSAVSSPLRLRGTSLSERGPILGGSYLRTGGKRSRSPYPPIGGKEGPVPERSEVSCAVKRSRAPLLCCGREEEKTEAEEPDPMGGKVVKLVSPPTVVVK